MHKNYILLIFQEEKIKKKISKLVIYRKKHEKQNIFIKLTYLNNFMQYQLKKKK